MESMHGSGAALRPLRGATGLTRLRLTACHFESGAILGEALAALVLGGAEGAPRWARCRGQGSRVADNVARWMTRTPFLLALALGPADSMGAAPAIAGFKPWSWRAAGCRPLCWRLSSRPWASRRPAPSEPRPCLPLPLPLSRVARPTWGRPAPPAPSQSPRAEAPALAAVLAVLLGSSPPPPLCATSAWSSSGGWLPRPCWGSPRVSRAAPRRGWGRGGSSACSSPALLPCMLGPAHRPPLARRGPLPQHLAA